MGGADKGLQPHLGSPLVAHALQRLTPQVGRVMISANRHLAEYRTFGVPVWPDAEPGFAGPLAGMLAGLERCGTPWLVSVPCDTPGFPADLVARLASAVGDADIAVAATASDGEERLQPVFCLMKVSMLAGLRRHIAAGERKAAQWIGQCRSVVVPFADASAFFNINTPADMARWEQDGG